MSTRPVRPFRGGLVVISGPSGSGKTTIVERLEADPRVRVAVTATTRAKRPHEVDGVDYYFLTREQFLAKMAANEFLETNEVFANGNLYGSLKAPLETALRETSRCYVLEIDVEGGLAVRKLGYPGLWIFIAPPSLDELRRRIEKRGTESADQIAVRMKKVATELELKKHYDEVVVNEDLDRALADVRGLMGLDAP
jgi:guanylate kinase